MPRCRWQPTSRVDSHEDGSLVCVPWPSIATAPRTSRQNKHLSHAEQPVWLAGRFEFESQLSLDHQDQVNLPGGEPVFVHGLAELAHPHQLDAIPGEHSPDVSERCGPDLAGFPVQDVEYLNRALAVIVGCHKNMSAPDAIGVNDARRQSPKQHSRLPNGSPCDCRNGIYVTVVSPDDTHISLFVVIELRGCAEIRFGGPNDEAIAGHPLHGKGLAGYRAHEVVNSAWIEDAIRVNSVHPHHSDAPFRQLHHYWLMFHNEMLEALADGIEARLNEGTMREILTSLTGSLIDLPYRRA